VPKDLAQSSKEELLIKKCLHCGEVKPLASFYRHKGQSDGRRPECKECSKKKAQQRAMANPYEHALFNLSYNILKRTKKVTDRPKNKIYIERGIRCLLGENTEEIKRVLHEHFERDIKNLLEDNERPSVDRIDPYGHYELGNIQIISLHENLKRADHSHISHPLRVFYPNGEQKDFPSILAAAKYLGCKRDTIYASLDRPGINKKGLRFELLKKDA
jgi:hypothetical protein